MVELREDSIKIDLLKIKKSICLLSTEGMEQSDNYEKVD